MCSSSSAISSQKYQVIQMRPKPTNIELLDYLIEDLWVIVLDYFESVEVIEMATTKPTHEYADITMIARKCCDSQTTKTHYYLQSFLAHNLRYHAKYLPVKSLDFHLYNTTSSAIVKYECLSDYYRSQNIVFIMMICDRPTFAYCEPGAAGLEQDDPVIGDKIVEHTAQLMVQSKILPIMDQVERAVRDKKTILTREQSRCSPPAFGAR